MTFKEKVLAVVAQIPLGETRSYKDIAKAVGSPNASRAVGTVLKTNFNPDIPCHRVIRSNGSPGEYNRGGSTRKAEILKEEKEH